MLRNTVLIIWADGALHTLVEGSTNSVDRWNCGQQSLYRHFYEYAYLEEHL
jgi:hypothetical protein